MDEAGVAVEEEIMILPADYSDEANILWESATALNRAAARVSPHIQSLPPLLFFTDPARTPRPWETAARLPAGAAVVYRAFSRRDRFEVGMRLRSVTLEKQVKLLVGRDDSLAQEIGADGVHLPETSASRALEIRKAWPQALLTAAWHGETAPSYDGLDALVLSPLFRAGGASSEKPSLGVEAFRDKVQASSLPVYALGGVTAERAEALAATMACGLAGVDAVQAAFA